MSKYDRIKTRDANSHPIHNHYPFIMHKSYHFNLLTPI